MQSTFLVRQHYCSVLVESTSSSTQNFRCKPISKRFGYLQPSQLEIRSHKKNSSNDGTRGYIVEKRRFSRAGCRDHKFFGRTNLIGRKQDLLQLNQTTVQMMPANSSTAQSHTLKPLRFINWNRLIRSVAFCYLAVDKIEKRSSHLKPSHQAIA